MKPKPSSKEETIAGSAITWHLWTPPSGTFRATFFFLHGQGDHAQRYQEIAEVFIRQGIAFLSCDLPGHGLSAGKRGHIPSLDLVAEIVESGLSKARELSPHTPTGFGGHSVGGLLALHFLTRPNIKPDFSWVSSPLLNAEQGQPGWKPTILLPLSLFLPAITVSTGVQSEDLQRRPGKKKEVDKGLKSLFHNRISLSWGRQLLTLSREVRTQPEKQPSPLPFLLTQGEEDPICPFSICQTFVEQLNNEQMDFFTFPRSLHEPFSDENQEDFRLKLGKWLDKTLLAPYPSG